MLKIKLNSFPISRYFYEFEKRKKNNPSRLVVRLTDILIEQLETN